MESSDSPLRSADSGPAADSAGMFFPNFETVRLALESGKIGVWSWDIATNVITWSSNLESIHGLEPGSFDGSSAFFERDIHPDDRAGVSAAIREALRTQKSYRVRYRLPDRPEVEACWIEATASVLASDGVAHRMVGLCQDITDRIRLEHELRGRAKQQEAVAQLGERALTEQDLERLLGDVVSTVALTLGVQFVEILELMPGDTDFLLRAGFGWKPETLATIRTRTAAECYAGYTLASAVPVVIDEFKAEKRFQIPSYLHESGCKSGMGAVIAGRDGRAYGVLSSCATTKRHFAAQDVSFLAAVANVIAGAIQRRQLDQRHELMIRELRHRSGNLFSQLLALLSQTAKNSKNMSELVSKYEARVLALAHAHRLVTEGGWKSTSLVELLRVLLAAYVDRISFDGPEVYLEPDPAFSLSTAMHELLVNATKYGSLSRANGRLDLAWFVGRTERGITLTIDWIESNGPSARRPRRTGFGSRLINLVIERQLNGKVERTFTPDGLQVKLVVPLTHERWPGSSPVAESESPAQE
ncbi:MAG: HWE histidine kinase domain-containing protein [Steroidobacteraceae bacterium]